MNWKNQIKQRMAEMKEVALSAVDNSDLDTYEEISECLSIGYALLNHLKTMEKPIKLGFFRRPTLRERIWTSAPRAPKKIGLYHLKVLIENTLNVSLKKTSIVIGKKRDAVQIFLILCRQLKSATDKQLARYLKQDDFYISDLRKRGLERLKLDLDFYRKHKRCLKQVIYNYGDYNMN